MTHIRAVRMLLRPQLVLQGGRGVRNIARRRFATESPPPPREPSTRTGAFYKSFGSPVLKCFLGALFTYQVAYWTWLKLETLEEKKDAEDEITSLKGELKSAILEKRALVKEGVVEGKDKVEEVTEKAKTIAKKWW